MSGTVEYSVCVERAYGRPTPAIFYHCIITNTCLWIHVPCAAVPGDWTEIWNLFTLNEDCMGGSQSSPPQCAHLGAYLVVKGVVQDLEKEKSPKQCLYCLCLVLQGYSLDLISGMERHNIAMPRAYHAHVLLISVTRARYSPGVVVALATVAPSV